MNPKMFISAVAFAIGVSMAAPVSAAPSCPSQELMHLEKGIQDMKQRVLKMESEMRQDRAPQEREAAGMAVRSLKQMIEISERASQTCHAGHKPECPNGDIEHFRQEQETMKRSMEAAQKIHDPQAREAAMRELKWTSSTIDQFLNFCKKL